MWIQFKVEVNSQKTIKWRIIIIITPIYCPKMNISMLKRTKTEQWIPRWRKWRIWLSISHLTIRQTLWFLSPLHLNFEFFMACITKIRIFHFYIWQCIIHSDLLIIYSIKTVTHRLELHREFLDGVHVSLYILLYKQSRFHNVRLININFWINV